MNVALQKAWTIERFLDWAEAQDGRYEFDGVRPIAMTGGTDDHDRVTLNIHVALRARLRGTPCSHHGNFAVQTGASVRFPDAFITCTEGSLSDRIAQDVRIVFEVLSPRTASKDRITKLREYAAVPSILRYVLVETRFPGLTVLYRTVGSDPWTALALTLTDILSIPEAAIELPVAELYEDVVFPAELSESGL